MKHHRHPGSYLALIAWSIVCIFPIYWAGISSIKPPGEFIGPPHYLPFVDFAPSLAAWNHILFEAYGEVPLRFLNSIVVATVGTAICLAAGSLAAYPLARSVWGTEGRSGARWLLIAILGTRILPPVVVVLPLYYLANASGLFDTRLLLALVYASVNLPIAIWLMTGFFRDIPVDIEESAMLDGASRLRIFFTLVLPIARVGLVAAFVLIFLMSWNEYFIATYLTADHAMTMPPYLASQMTTREQMAAAEPDDYARLGVVIVLMFLPALLFVGLIQATLLRVAGADRRRQDQVAARRA